MAEGFNLASMLADVSKMGTGGPEQIEYIDIDLIDDDPRNFYELKELDRLAENIELIGLQDPLRVRQSPDDPQRVVIVSGHRRRAAIRKLVEDGRDDLRRVPCIRDRAAGSEAMQELRLIYANSDTRVLSSPELSRQAERVEALLYQLKEEGYEFPGRMRDHVAEACKVSKSKLARLKVIREKLIPEYKKAYEKGKLNESTAYAIAQQEPETQAVMLRFSNLEHFPEWTAKNMAEVVTEIRSRMCKKTGGACTNQDAVFERSFAKDRYCYSTRACGPSCCEQCVVLASCKSACPLLAGKIKKLKAERRERNQAEAQERSEREAPDVELIQEIWDRFGRARRATGKTPEEYMETVGGWFPDETRKHWTAFENLTAKFTASTDTPFGRAVGLSEVKKLRGAADFLGVTTDYLLARPDLLGRSAPEPAPAASGWRTDSDYPDGWIVAAVSTVGGGGWFFPSIYVEDGELFMDSSCMVEAEVRPQLWMPAPGRELAALGKLEEEAAP